MPAEINTRTKVVRVNLMNSNTSLLMRWTVLHRVQDVRNRRPDAMLEVLTHQSAWEACQSLPIGMTYR